MKIHQNVHKNLKKREKHVCFINDCEKVYLYLCTLKKHIESSHKTEYDQLNQFYNNESFQIIMKKLADDKKEFKFICFKDPSSNIVTPSQIKVFSDTELTIESQDTTNLTINNSKTSKNFLLKKTRNESFSVVGKSNVKIDNKATFNPASEISEFNNRLAMLTNSIYSQQLMNYRNNLLAGAYFPLVNNYPLF